jgi:hypothetical protein
MDLSDFAKSIAPTAEYAARISQQLKQEAGRIPSSFSEAKLRVEATAAAYAQRATDLLAGKIPTNSRGIARDGWNRNRA